MNRKDRDQLDLLQRTVAAAGTGFSVPVAEVDKDGKPSTKRLPLTLDMHPPKWLRQLRASQGAA